MIMSKISPLIHPGLILRDEFFAPLGITQLAAAKATGIPQSRLSEILAGRRSITADTAARLGRFFQVDPRSWLNLQAMFDLREMERSHGWELSRVIPAEQMA
ncbi:MAG: HigA family addiction module antidote protein [Opitutaceae bacterium]|nr:HigA family addiction module antidote protein [Opitutaceae bacterium]